MQRKPAVGELPPPCGMIPLRYRWRDIMDFLVNGARRRIEINRLVVAGWTGRDKAAVEKHIAELGAIGGRRPPALPTFYRVGAGRLPSAGGDQPPGRGAGRC